MLTISSAVKLWYATEPVNFRLGFDGLYALVRSRLSADPLSGHLFIFHNKTAKVPAEQRFQTAGPEQVGPIAKGLCDPGLLAHAITAKFADHTPLHRLAGQLCRSGVEIAASTLGGWMAQAANLLSPLTQLMHQRLLLSRVIHGEDTGVNLRVPGAPKTPRAHFWVGIGDADYPYVVFDFTADHTAEGPCLFFAG
jgi:transposase